MARVSECERMVQLIETDERFLMFDRGVAMVWLMLMRLIRRHGTDGHLRLGSGMGFSFGSMREIALALRIGETELETHLVEFGNRSLVGRPDAHSLCLAPCLMPTARQIAARENGKKGGRTKKNTVPNGQSELGPMVIPGGLSEALQKPSEPKGETQMEPKQAGLTRAGGCLADTKKAKLSSYSDTEKNEIGRAAFEAAGFDVARDKPTWGIVHDWVERGADRDLILGVIAEVLARPNQPKPQTLAYFTKAVLDAIAALPPPQVPGFAEWEEANRRFCANGQRGNPPVLADFQRRALAS